MATLRNLGITLLRQAGHRNIAAAGRRHARNATRVLAILNPANHDETGLHATMPEP